jgi:CelD/BcsL family acetyltransferase involved in cellulose biosynthesis
MSTGLAGIPERIPPGSGEDSVSEAQNRRAAGVSAMSALRPAWERLGADHPMRSYAWAHACAEAFPNNGLHIVSAGESAPRAIAAFVCGPDSRTLVPLGAQLYEPAEFACADASAAEALGETIARLETTVLIRDIYADSPVVKGLQRAGGRRVVTQPVAGHPWLKLDDSWLEAEQHLNAGRRSDLRRAQRNAAKLGAVTCEITCPTAAELTPLLDEAFLVEAAGWKGNQGSALATDPHVGGFYRRYAEAACLLGTLRIGILRIGGRAAAMQFAVEQGGCFWLFKMGFDESFARFSPGTLLMVESLRRARLRGCQRYELMGQSEAWNQIWAPRLHEAVSVQLHAPTVRSWVKIIEQRAKGALKRQLLLHREKATEKSK